MKKGQLTFEDLAEALRRGAGPNLGVQAAVGLLIAHHKWLEEAECLLDHIDVVGSDERPLAFVDFASAIGDGVHFALGGGAEGIFRVAASLASHVPVDLGAAASRLDRTNAGRVVDAIAHAARLDWQPGTKSAGAGDGSTGADPFNRKSYAACDEHAYLALEHLAGRKAVVRVVEKDAAYWCSCRRPAAFFLIEQPSP